MMEAVEIAAHRQRPVSPEALRRLYDHLEWWPERSESEIAVMLRSTIAVGAWQGCALVGFARLVTDGPLRAYVEDVAVHERMRRQGVGTTILERLLDEATDVDIVSLFCEAELVPFYERLGFRPTSQVVLHRRRGSGQP